MKKSDFIKITPMHKNVVKSIIENGGKCSSVDCLDCPFFQGNSTESTPCYIACATSLLSSYEPDEKLLQSCKEFLDLFRGYWRVNEGGNNNDES